ncbi:teichoic acid transporter [Anopheles sinensis]|uniref:Teichoic acid transporter n=1 Tax=Anopheles sinensis TaxID=74873 RepID=A0A084WH91_ANOSI|nr:teichoic acid transporter [Anopheles sinensis]
MIVDIDAQIRPWGRDGSTGVKGQLVRLGGIDHRHVCTNAYSSRVHTSVRKPAPHWWNNREQKHSRPRIRAAIARNGTERLQLAERRRLTTKTTNLDSRTMWEATEPEALRRAHGQSRRNRDGTGKWKKMEKKKKANGNKPQPANSHPADASDPHPEALSHGPDATLTGAFAQAAGANDVGFPASSI